MVLRRLYVTRFGVRLRDSGCHVRPSLSRFRLYGSVFAFATLAARLGLELWRVCVSSILEALIVVGEVFGLVEQGHCVLKALFCPLWKRFCLCGHGLAGLA